MIFDLLKKNTPKRLKSNWGHIKIGLITYASIEINSKSNIRSSPAKV